MTNVLRRIFGVAAREFVTRWPYGWLHAPADESDRLAALQTGLLAEIASDLRSVARLLPEQQIEVFDATLGSPAFLVSAEEAHRALHERGLTVRLRRVDARVPAIAELQHELIRALAPTTRVRQVFANVFISPPGWRCAPHFDGHEVIVLNLLGCKAWSFAGPDVVEHACLGFELGSRQPAIMQFGVRPEQFPRTLPDARHEVTLAPGDSLFLPRGFYHQTHARTLSVQVTLSLVSNTRAEVAAQTLFRRLLRDPSWRRLASEFAHCRPSSMLDAAASMLDELQATIAAARSPQGLEEFAADMFEALNGPPAPRYLRNPYSSASRYVPHGSRCCDGWSTTSSPSRSTRRSNTALACPRRLVANSCVSSRASVCSGVRLESMSGIRATRI